MNLVPLALKILFYFIYHLFVPRNCNITIYFYIYVFLTNILTYFECCGGGGGGGGGRIVVEK